MMVGVRIELDVKFLNNYIIVLALGSLPLAKNAQHSPTSIIIIIIVRITVTGVDPCSY